MTYSKYPGEIDDDVTLPVTVDLVTEVKAEVVNRLRDSIIATESTIGADPTDGYATLKDRLDAMQAEISGGGGGISGSGTENYITRWDAGNNVQDSPVELQDDGDVVGIRNVTYKENSNISHFVADSPVDTAGRSWSLYAGTAGAFSTTQRSGGLVTIYAGYGGNSTSAVKGGPGGNTRIYGGPGGNSASGEGGDGGNTYVNGGSFGFGTPNGSHGQVFVGTLSGTSAVNIGNTGVPTNFGGLITIPDPGTDPAIELEHAGGFCTFFKRADATIAGDDGDQVRFLGSEGANGTTSSGGDGGSFSFEAADAGAAGTSGSGGWGGFFEIFIGRGGTSSATGNGGDGGIFKVYGGKGGFANGASATGGWGGYTEIISGYGGDATGGGDAERGGHFLIQSGYGGTNYSTGSTREGGTVFITSGDGGNATSGGNASIATGGNIELTCGDGGNGTVAGGAGGSLIGVGGAGGTGSNTNGGSVSFDGGAANASGQDGSINLGTTTVYAVNIGKSGSRLGFHGAAAVTKRTVSGSRGGNAALASLLTALATLGLVTDSTSA